MNENQEKDFAQFLKEFISSEEFKTEMKKQGKGFLPVILIGSIIPLFFVFVDGLRIYALSLFLILISYAAIYYAKRNNKNMKKIVLPKLFSYSENFEVVNTVNFDYLMSLALLKKSNKLEYDDAFKGTYNSLPFEISEISTDYFKGILIQFPYHTDFDVPVIVKPHNDYLSEEDSKEKIKFENEEFNKIWDVFSASEEAARNVVTDSMIRKLFEIFNKEIFRKSMISFEKGNVNIAVKSSKDWFEVKDAEKAESYKSILEEINTLLQAVDILKQN